MDLMAIEPDTVRDLTRIGAKQREWTDKRNAAIVQARRDGASLREIGEAVGLSHSAVARIVKKGG